VRLAEAERQIIAEMVDRQSVIAGVSKILGMDGDVFNSRYFRQVYLQILDQYMRGKKIDIGLKRGEHKGRALELCRLVVHASKLRRIMSRGGDAEGHGITI
jgi:replicative DNA helicase